MEESRPLRLPAVLKLTGLKKSSIYAKAKEGRMFHLFKEKLSGL